MSSNYLPPEGDAWKTPNNKPSNQVVGEKEEAKASSPKNPEAQEHFKEVLKQSIPVAIEREEEEKTR